MFRKNDGNKRNKTPLKIFVKWINLLLLKKKKSKTMTLSGAGGI